MKRSSVPSGMVAMLGVIVPGLAGLFVVGRALGVYLEEGDRLAACLVVFMGVGLCVGLIELCVRVVRAAALEREALALPKAPTEVVLDSASPQLAAMLRARVEHVPMPALPESVTPYLVGLLVMLGLLGTLLGLFETLGGAGKALSESVDIDALRRGLSRPIHGLTRSFGCSAAGVSASAMLGLSAVLVRRREARALRVIHAYATGPLRALSPVRRQLHTLERLASQGDSLPRAADALAQAAERLGGLAERWEEAHRKAAEAQQKGIQEAFEKLQAQLAKAAADAGRTVTNTVGPLVEQVMAKTAETAARHMASTLEVLERDLHARREADAALRKALRDELEAMRTWVEQDARAKTDDTQQRLEAFEQTMKRHAAEQAAALAEQRSQAAQELAAFSEVARSFASSLADTRADERERLVELRAELERQNQALSERWAALASDERERLVELRAELERQNQALSEQWAALASEVTKSAEFTRSEEEARLARLDAMTQRFGAELGQLAASMAQQLDARLEREKEQIEQSKEAMASILASGKALEDALARQELAVQALLEGSAEQLAKMGAVSQEGAQKALERLAAVTDQQADRFAELEQRLSAGHVELAQRLGAELAAQAERLGQGLNKTTELVHEAASVLKASSVEMGAVAEMFAKSVERQREAAQSWLESLGEVEGAVERAGRNAAADALGDQLASTQEVFARQLQFQRELFEQLRSLRMTPAVSAREEHDVSA